MKTRSMLAAVACAILVMLSPVFVPCSALAAVIFDESIDGDMSDDHTAPEDLGTLVLGDSSIIGSLGNIMKGGDRDFWKFEIGFEHELSEIIITQYASNFIPLGNGGFFGVENAASITSVAFTQSTANNLKGAALIGLSPGSQPGDNVLDDLAEDFVFPPLGITVTGFSPARLGEGVYSFWFQEGDPVAAADASVNYSLTFSVGQVPEPNTLVAWTILGAVGFGLLHRRRKARLGEN